MRKTRPRHSLSPCEPVPGIAHKEARPPRTRPTRPLKRRVAWLPSIAGQAHTRSGAARANPGRRITAPCFGNALKFAGLRCVAVMRRPPMSVCPARKTQPWLPCHPSKPVPSIARKAEHRDPREPFGRWIPPARERASGKEKCERRRRHFPRQPHPHFAPKVSLALGGRRFALSLTARPWWPTAKSPSSHGPALHSARQAPEQRGPRDPLECAPANSNALREWLA